MASTKPGAIQAEGLEIGEERARLLNFLTASSCLFFGGAGTRFRFRQEMFPLSQIIFQPGNTLFQSSKFLFLSKHNAFSSVFAAFKKTSGL
jgi:hypothetical protein